jgi:hypothetical protein
MPGRAATDRAIRHRFRKYHIRGEWYEPAQSILNFIERECRPLQETREKPFRLRDQTTICIRGSQELKLRMKFLRSMFVKYGRAHHFNDWLNAAMKEKIGNFHQHDAPR